MTAPAESRISDERLDRLLFALNGHPDHGSSIVDTDTIRAALTELRERRAQAVTVKPLEWEDVVAPTPFGTYTVSEDADDCWHFTYHEYPYGTEDDEAFATEAEAKAAAFADYKQRILSALAAPPPAQAAGVTVAEQRLRAQIERLIYAGDQFAAFDGFQTTDTADQWTATRAIWERRKKDAEASLYAQDREE